MNRPNHRRDAITGLFVILGLTVFVVLLLWVAGVRPGTGEQTRHEVRMRDSGGVRAGDPVRLAGVAVGRVEAVELRADPEWPVAFRVTLDAGIPINDASRARFASDGLLGARFLALEPGPEGGAPLADGAPIYGTGAPGLDETLSRVGDVVERASVLLEETTFLVRGLPERIDPVLSRVEALLSEQNVEDASATLAEVRRIVEATGPRLPTLLDRLDATLAELETGAADLPALTTEARGLVADVRTSLGPDGRRLTEVLDSADHTLDAATDTFGAVSGSVGEIEAGLRDLRAAASHLEALARALEERPNTLILGSRTRERRPGEGVDR